MHSQNRATTPSYFVRTGNMALLFWSFLEVLLMTELYRAKLLTYLLQHPDTNPFQNADQMIDLVARKEFRLVTNYIGNWSVLRSIHNFFCNYSFKECLFA